MTTSQKSFDLKSTLGHSALLLISTIVWGIAFVAQKTGGDIVGAFTFSGIRILIAAVCLLIVVLIRAKKVKRDKKALFKGGIICGVLLTGAINFQQLGINAGASAGEAGFITAMYIVLVPIFAFIFYKKKSGWNVWLGVLLAMVSLYLLSVTESFTFAFADVLVFACAVVFAIQILSIDKYVKQVDPLELTCVQFFVCGIISCILMLIFEVAPSPSAWATSLSTLNAWIPLLYAAFISGCIGYTFQTIGQKGVNPTLAALIMSLESVFSVVAGWLILHEELTTREWIGCVSMFVAIILAQIPFPVKTNKKSANNSAIEQEAPLTESKEESEKNAND